MVLAPTTALAEVCEPRSVSCGPANHIHAHFDLAVFATQGLHSGPSATKTTPARGDRTRGQQNKLGNYHCNNRVYSIGAGRWLSPDQAARPFWNRFEYAAARPVQFVDPSGLRSAGKAGRDKEEEKKSQAEWDEAVKKHKEEAAARREQAAMDRAIAKAKAEEAARRAAEKERRKANGTDKVELCERTIKDEGCAGDCANATGARHQWLKACNKEVGLGRQGGGQPEDGGCPVGIQAELVSHEGQSEWDISKCREISGVDVDCVCAHMIVGKQMGRWMALVNDCNTWAAEVIEKCSPKVRVTKYEMKTIVIGGGMGGSGLGGPMIVQQVKEPLERSKGPVVELPDGTFREPGYVTD